MHASAPVAPAPRLGLGGCSVMPQEPNTSQPTEAGSAAEVETKQAIRELLDVLPKDILEELNSGAIDLKDPAFLDGLTDHVSRLSLASPREGQKILGKIIRLK